MINHQTIRSISTPTKCQSLCKVDVNCNYFTFDENNDECHMSIFVKSIVTNDYATSGPKYCTYEMKNSGTNCHEYLMLKYVLVMKECDLQYI